MKIYVISRFVVICGTLSVTSYIFCSLFWLLVLFVGLLMLIHFYFVFDFGSFHWYFKGELWVKLNFHAQLRHNVSYLHSNCE